WVVGLRMDDPAWDATTLTKIRDRLLEGEIADAFFREVLAEAEAAGLVSDEHFTVDGTLLEAWANQCVGHSRTRSSANPGIPARDTALTSAPPGHEGRTPRSRSDPAA